MAWPERIASCPLPDRSMWTLRFLSDAFQFSYFPFLFSSNRTDLLFSSFQKLAKRFLSGCQSCLLHIYGGWIRPGPPWFDCRKLPFWSLARICPVPAFFAEWGEGGLPEGQGPARVRTICPCVRDLFQPGAFSRLQVRQLPHCQHKYGAEGRGTPDCLARFSLCPCRYLLFYVPCNFVPRGHLA